MSTVRDPDRYRALGIEAASAKLHALKLQAMGPRASDREQMRTLLRRAGDIELERLALVDDPSPHTEARARLEAAYCYGRAAERAKAGEQRQLIKAKGLPR